MSASVSNGPSRRAEQFDIRMVHILLLFGFKHALNAIAIIRMHSIQKRVQPLVYALARKTKDLFVGGIDVQKFRDASICYPDHIIDILGELTKALFTFIK